MIKNDKEIRETATGNGIPSAKGRAGRRMILVPLTLLCLGILVLSCGSCNGGAWFWLWSSPEEETIDRENMVVGTVTETLPPETAAWGSVLYTGEAHEGTHIVYVGKGDNRNTVIVIDAGHQEKGNAEREPAGPDATTMQAKVASGTEGAFTGTREYDLNLRVALLLRDELVKRGYTVVMIRETNQVNISNAERAEIANLHFADAFIRIHANGWDDPQKKGATMVCQSAANPYPDCAAVYPESRLLSECILDAYCQTTGMEKLSILEMDNMAGTNWSQVPTTILEMGFMTNQEDDETMSTEAFQKAAAQGIADGLEKYLDAVQKMRAAS